GPAPRAHAPARPGRRQERATLPAPVEARPRRRRQRPQAPLRGRLRRTQGTRRVRVPLPHRRGADGKNDQITLADCQSCVYKPVIMSDKPRVLILKNHLSPGDVLCMTAAVASLHAAHPGRYRIAVDTPCPQLWECNPTVIPVEQAQAEQGEVV